MHACVFVFHGTNTLPAAHEGICPNDILKYKLLLTCCHIVFCTDDVSQKRRKIYADKYSNSATGELS